MRNLKKALVLVLTLAMVLGIMVVGAGAAFTDQSEVDTKHQEAVDMAVTLNIIQGYPDGSFKPNGDVTREEMAKMICILDNGGKEPQLATGSTFTDVAPDRWSNKYIEACAARGVVSGVGNNQFNPAGNVTATQAAKMLLVELGYDEDLAKYVGSNWATNVNVDATKKGYYDDLEDIDVTAPLTREHAAQMVWNALQAFEVEYKNTLTTDPATGQLTSKVVVEDKTVGAFGAKISLLADKYDVTDDESGQMVGFTYNSNKSEWTYSFRTPNVYGVANETFFGGGGIVNFKSDKDYTDLYLQDVKVVYKNNADRDVLGMFAEGSKVLENVLVDKIDLSGVKTDSVKIDGTSYDFGKGAGGGNQNDTQVAVFEYLYGTNNATQYDPTGGAPVFLKNPGAADELAKGRDGAYEIQAIDYDDNGDVNFFIIHPFDVQKVTNVGTKSFTAGATYKFDDVTVYDGIAKNDYVKITAAANTYDNTAVFEKLTKNTDKAQAVNKSNDVEFGGTWYKLNTVKVVTPPAPAAGTDYDYVAVNGYLFMLDGVTLGDAEDFVLVEATAFVPGGVDNTYATKVLKADGKEETVQVISVDGGFGPAVPGTLYYFEQDDDDYYELTSAWEGVTGTPGVNGATTNGTDNTTKTGDGLQNVDFDIVGNPANGTDVDDTANTANGATFVNGTGNDKNYILDSGVKYYFKDDAKFFVTNTTDNSYSVISGAKMKTTAQTPTVAFFAANENSDTKFMNVEMAYVYLGGTISAGDTLYGYVTADAVKAQASGSSTKFNVTISFWDGKQDQTLTTKDAANGTFINNAAGLAAGDVFKYELNDDGKIDSIFVYGSACDYTDVANTSAVFDGTGTTNTLYTAAISGYSNSDKLVTFTGDDIFVEGVTTAHPSGWLAGADVGMLVGTDTLKITDDTVLMFVDNDANTGETGDKDSIQIAIQDTFGTGVTRTGYVANAMVIEDPSGEIALLVVDINNDMIGVE